MIIDVAYIAVFTCKEVAQKLQNLIGEKKLMEVRRKMVLLLMKMQTILSLLINHGKIRENERLKCDVRGVKKQGKARKEAIICGCCNKLMSVSEFENHVGDLSKRPYDNIFTIRTNNSLLKHLLNLLNKEDRMGQSQFNEVVPKLGAEDGNDDTCQVCVDGGELLCCEGCPSTFHLTCTEMMEVPKEKWHCCYCKCKYCGDESNSQEHFACFQCLRKLHFKCYRTRGFVDLNDDRCGLYCSSTCKEVAQKLQSMTGVKKINDRRILMKFRRMEAFELEDDHNRWLKCGKENTDLFL
ncbi:Acyl-CoA N-acyltransferase with RING/FYVE/PHD-type zinc finger protein [Euphorbia peplus]|nr:Acyl-CoA N-acyltransferase with RING/FYVE/PHD-type zinc finger protein [Euphorbia peplus]